MTKHIFTMKSTFFTLFSMIIITKVSAICTPCEGPVECDTRASPSVLALTQLRVYGSTIDEFTTVLVEDALDLQPVLDPTLETVIYIFGWMGGPDDESTAAIVGALLQRGGYNVMVVDWSHIAGNIIYPYAALSVDGVACTVADALRELIAAGILSLSRMGLIGHSLGAQTCGFIGRYLDGGLARITGLDPAGPLFYELIDDLTSSDAIFVMIIHSNPGLAGTALSLGHVDFWPNGRLGGQPGCSSVGCSHSRSWMYEAESITNPNAFIAVQCDSYGEFMMGLCSSNEQVVMGWETPNTAFGDHFLQTNPAPPFGRGGDGTTYDPDL